MNNPKQLKPMLHHYSDEEADRFLEEENLGDYDLSGFKPTHFEFAKKEARLELRLPSEQLVALKAEAQKMGIPHTRLVRQFITEGLMKKSA
jgi:predicted DNA binding CopG/RHH family protein